MRWSPGAADFMRDSMDLFEQRGMNHAFWAWNPLWPPYSHIDGMNYLRGPDPDDHTDLATSDLIDVITTSWGRNTIRPSSVAEKLAASPTPLPEQPSPQLAEASFRRVIFLHHSCGANLIEQGGVRQRLAELGYEFYDHGYNEDGLVLADGTWTGRNFDVPDDNTDPSGFAAVFTQPLHDSLDNTFSHLMQYDVIAFKSCFPVSLIESDEELAGYKSYYLTIRGRMDQYPNKIFIVVTQPPEIPADSDAEMAARARAFTNWLASDEYLSGHSNVFTFNFFDLLADPSTNMLRPEYQTAEDDAHPNELANQTIAPLFVDFIDQAVRTYIAR